MITVIVPTMCFAKKEFLQYTLGQMEKNGNVKQIFIIDNTVEKKVKNYYNLNKKCSVFEFGGNIGVNPAWNFGMEKCDTKYYCLLNDDLLCHSEVFNRVVKLLDDYPHYNIVTTGLIEDIPISIDSYEKICSEVIDTPTTCKDIDKFGWRGCIMFGRTKTSMPIEKLTIFYGDNFIYRYSAEHGYTNTVILPIPVLHSEFTTSHKISWDEKIFVGTNKEEIVRNEEKIWLTEISKKYMLPLSPKEIEDSKKYK